MGCFAWSNFRKFSCVETDKPRAASELEQTIKSSLSLNWEFPHLLCLRQPLFCQRGVNPEITALRCDFFTDNCCYIMLRIQVLFGIYYDNGH